MITYRYDNYTYILKLKSYYDNVSYYFVLTNLVIKIIKSYDQINFQLLFFKTI